MELRATDFNGKPYRSIKIDKNGYDYTIEAYDYEEKTSISMTFSKDQMLDLIVMIMQSMPLIDPRTAVTEDDILSTCAEL